MSNESLNTHAIFALISELKNWEGSRVLNIYDINLQTICIKFNMGNSTKKYLLIESGSKFYWLDNFNATKDFPSSFSSKLRKHLNNKRLESIEQINLDRVIDLKFGTGELAYHIIGEFYASGNIILTDYEYKILTLIHPYTYTDGTKVCVGNKYLFENSTQLVPIEFIGIKNTIEENIKLIDKKQKLKQFIKKLPIIKYSFNVLVHSLILAGIDPEKKIDSNTKFEEIFSSQEIFELFSKSIAELYSFKEFKGYKNLNNIYPYPYAQLKSEQLCVYKSFGILTSEYFQKLKPIETKEIIKIKQTKEKITKQEKIIENVQNQINGMEEKILNIKQKIDLIQLNTNILTEFIAKVNLNINLGLINQFIELKSNIICKSINYEKKEILIEFENMNLTVNYTKSIWDNITELYFGLKKIQEKLNNAVIILEKQKKLISKVTTVILPNSYQLGNNSSNEKVHFNIIGQSKSNWFEQFNWFISSDGLVVISGKTAEQNEQIVKKYMDLTDIYIHSEVFGSGSCVIKNKLGSKLDISECYPRTIVESGLFLIAHTKAWGLGAINNAYWVYPSQVSKTPETGEYIGKGSFIIRGQKNPIIVDKLELGFGIIFKLKGKEEFVSEINSLNNVKEQIEYAIPMVSPYSTQIKNKFKIKFISGNQKIKKILPEILKLFEKKANIYEKDAIKKISNDSIQKVLINGVKFFL